MQPHDLPKAVQDMQSRHCSLAVATVLMLWALPEATSKSDDLSWPGWRGADRQGVILNARLPKQWPNDPPSPVWKQDVGSGWSSPVVAEGLVFVTDRVSNTERVLGLDANSGDVRWRKTNPVDFDPHPVGRRHGNGPKATAYYHQGKLYTLGIAGWLQCLNARDGSLLWKVVLPDRFGRHVALASQTSHVNGTQDVVVPIGSGEGAAVPLFGYTGSPVIAAGKLICSVGGENGGTIMALDADSGRVAWKSLDENVSYSSPVVAMIAGRPQVVVMTGPRVVGLDLQDGHLLWSHPFQIQYNESISTPVIDGDLVLVTGDGRPLTALRIQRNGSQFTKEVAWTNDLLSSYLSSMLIYNGHVYGMNDGGEFACLRLSDGHEIWVGGDHGFYCTPLRDGDRILALNEQGVFAILSASPKAYRLLGEFKVATTQTWTSPAVVGGRIYIRTASDVRCFDFAP